MILIGGTVYSFIGMMESEFRWPVFWSCAAGALVIILLRNVDKRDWIIPEKNKRFSSKNIFK